MSQLGDFLEIVYGPDGQFATVRATIHQWSNRGVAENAGRRSVMGRRKFSTQPAHQVPAIDEAKISVWIKQPDRYRIVKDEKVKGQAVQSLVIVNGERQWKMEQQGEVETSKASEDTDVARHFDRESLREYFVALTLQQLGSVQTVGRNCVRLRAIPRPGARLWPHWLPCGADEYEFHADLDRGVLLYIAGRYKDEIFEVNEVVQVAFDEPIDDTLFSYTPAIGEEVRPADPIVEHLTLEAAVARMPFTVLIPTRVPDPEHNHFEVLYYPPRSRSRRRGLSLMYRGGQSLWIHESDSAEPDLANMEWEQIERDGKRMSISDPGGDAGTRILAMEQQGTHVMIVSDLDRERLIDVAASLVAAS
jgi:hypothetical protein